MAKKEITKEDIIDIDSYIKQRDLIKKNIKVHKNNRRVHVGPHQHFTLSLLTQCFIKFKKCYSLKEVV